MEEKLNEKKTASPHLRNEGWKKSRGRNQKGKQLITNIPTDNVIKLNDLIYA